MRSGFSTKELSNILGIDGRVVSRKVDPAMKIIAMLWDRSPTKTVELLLDTVTKLRRCRAGELSDAKMSEAEINERTCRLQCRYDTPEKGCLEHLADVADGRAAHPMDKRI